MERRYGLNHLKFSCESVCKQIYQQSFPQIESIQKQKQLMSAFSLIINLDSSSLKFYPSNLPRTILSLKKHIEPYVYEHPLLRKILQDYLKGLSSERPEQFLYQSSLRFIYSLPELLQNILLHKAVFQGNSQKIRKLCVGENKKVLYVDIETTDHLGNTPLMLAVKLRKKQEIFTLLDHGADPKYRDTPSSVCPLQQAIAIKDRKILKMLIQAQNRNRYLLWQRNLKEFVETIKEMPDFSMVMEWKFDSMIPFVSKVTPSDSYQIYKRGSLVRIDLSLIGWKNMKSKRGNLSIIFRGDQCTAYVVDRNQDSVRQITGELTELQIQTAVEKLLKKKKFSNELQFTEVKMKPQVNWRGQQKTKQIENWLCQKQKITCKVNIEKEQRQIVQDQNLINLRSFKQYLKQKKKKVQIGQPSNIQNLLSPRVYKQISKKIGLSLWTCPNFPLRLKNFLPLLDLLTNISRKAAYIRSFFQRSLQNHQGFPIKANIPVYTAFKLKVMFKETSLNSPSLSLFQVHPKHEGFSDLNSDQSTVKQGDLSSDLYYFRCERSESDDQEIQDVQQQFLRLETLQSPQMTQQSENMTVSSQQIPKKVPMFNIEKKNKKILSINKKKVFNRIKEFIERKPERDLDVDIVL